MSELRVVVREADGGAAEHHEEHGETLERVVAQQQKGDGDREVRCGAADRVHAAGEGLG